MNERGKLLVATLIWVALFYCFAQGAYLIVQTLRGEL